MKPQTKNIIIVCLLVALAVVSWVAFKKEPPAFDNTLYEIELKKTKQERDSLSVLMSVKEIMYKKASDKIDSLENLKPKIKYVYIEKYKSIDRADIRSNDSLLRANLGIGK